MHKAITRTQEILKKHFLLKAAPYSINWFMHNEMDDFPKFGQIYKYIVAVLITKNVST